MSTSVGGCSEPIPSHLPSTSTASPTAAPGQGERGADLGRHELCGSRCQCRAGTPVLRPAGAGRQRTGSLQAGPRLGQDYLEIPDPSRSQTTSPATPPWRTWTAMASTRSSCTRLREAETTRFRGSQERRPRRLSFGWHASVAHQPGHATSAKASTTPSSWSTTSTATARAEMACKTADGTRDGRGQVIGDPDKDWRNKTEGTPDLRPDPRRPGILHHLRRADRSRAENRGLHSRRDPIDGWGGIGGNGGNDSYGNRCDRFLACVAYLDGMRPSVVMCRGVYGRIVHGCLGLA